MEETVKEQRKEKRTILGFLKDIVGHIWGVWAMISFAITFLIIFPFSMMAYLIPGAKGQDYFIAVSRWWIRVWLIIVACPLSVKGRKNFKKGENYVIVYNHNALLDVPLSAPFVPGGNMTIAKASFAKVPIFGWFYKRGSVLVDRDDTRSRVKSFEAMRNVLRNHLHMCIYPEGTRNRSDEPLKPFFDGAFKLAIDTKKDVMPCVIFGTKEATPINKGLYLFPTVLKIHFLPPVSSEGMKAAMLKEKVFGIMKDYYVSDGKSLPHPDDV